MERSEESRDTLLNKIKSLGRQVSDLTKSNQDYQLENTHLNALVEKETVLRNLPEYAVLQARSSIKDETIARQDKEIAFLEGLLGKKYGSR